MKNFLLTCFLALLCLVGRHLAASSKVADSPQEVPLHRSASDVSPHSGDTNRGGAILSDTFSRIKVGLIDSDQDMGAGEETVSLQPAPVTVLATPKHVRRGGSHISNFPNQLSLELSGDEGSKLASHSSGLSTVDCGPENETATSLFGAPRSDVSHLPSQKGTSLVDNSTSQGQEEGNTPAQVGEGIEFLPASEASPFIEEKKKGFADSLQIGDQLPRGLEVAVPNYPDGKIQLDDYRGKYLLLVFWSPTCSGSIGSLPKIDQLTQKYKDKLEVIPVTVFPEERVLKVAEIYPSFQQLSLPMATEANYLRTLFPHIRIPHVVLVDPEGKIKAITGAEDITAKNLNDLFLTGSAGFRIKKDKKILLNLDERLISENTHLENKNIWLQSALTGYLPNVGGSLIQNFDGFSHIRIVNMTPVYLYQLAYSERNLVDYYGINRIETIGFDTEELFTEKAGADFHEWAEEGNHVFSYELIAPPSYKPYELMREDLKRYFPHIEASVQTQTRKVFALVQLEGKEYPESISDKRTYSATPMGVSMTKYPLQGFVYHLNVAFWMTRPIPIVNMTGIDYPIDLEMDAPLGNYEKLRAALQKNGLDLIEQEEEIKILVLKKISPFKTLTL